jgi:post-segregation antitoxin (ccd killing protein)
MLNDRVRKKLERRLRIIVRAERERRWLKENRAAIGAYNRRVAEHGILSDEASLRWSPMGQFTGV